MLWDFSHRAYDRFGWTKRGDALVITYVIHNSRSQAFHIVEEFVDKIGLQQTSLQHYKLRQGGQPFTVAFNVSAIGRPDDKETAVENVWTIPYLSHPLQRVTQLMINSWSHLKGLAFPLVNSKHITILGFRCYFTHQRETTNPGQTSSCWHSPDNISI